MTTYPSDAGMWLLLADDIREEQGNKLSILGYYAGEDILVEQDEVVIPSLALLLVMHGGQGYAELSFSVTSPTHEVLHEAQPHSVQMGEGGPLIRGVKFVGLHIVAGIYSVKVAIDHTIYVRTFQVKRSS